MIGCVVKHSASIRFAKRFQNISVQHHFVALSTSISKPREVNKYQNSCLLPTTKFEQRANAVNKEPEIQKFWKENNIFESVVKSNKGDKFVLHDGPPYANGDLHTGHALNKILKDVINRYHLLKGRKVSYVPGWDCHGLPIELKVLQGLKPSERQALSPVQLRKTAAAFAKSTMEAQSVAFQRYGVWGSWDRPYLTLQPSYEAAQIRVFGEMVAKGHIYRGKRPVNWSPSSRTALAEAELEYPDNHVSKSVYLAFRTTKLSPSLETALRMVSGAVDDVRVAIWTTTPWTIPANAAVAVNAQIRYSVVRHSSVMGGAHFIVASDLVSSFAAKCGLDTKMGDTLLEVAVVPGEALVGVQYQHPLCDRVSEIVLGGDYITTQSGTGLVHTAPGHGSEDYQTGLKYDLPMYSPVDDAGCFTDEAGPRFKGLDVLGKGNAEVIVALREAGVLVKEEAYRHKYPYDWRSKKPTIFRMTEQWFASVANFREESLRAVDQVQWVPAVGKNRIGTMLERRGEWCISRQRVWGVPIPAFFHKETGAPLLTAETIAHIESIVREHGADAWWEMSVEQLLPPALRGEAHQYVKGTDTMDVWFDSGTSWAGVLQDREDINTFPADLYLEGSDQHRGWFQSSLLTAVATKGAAPYKTVVTHGFVLDEKGMKMSKSLGNVVDPHTIIEGGANKKTHPAYGADTLRLWAAGVDYTADASIGSEVMRHVSESYRKLRITMRFLLGSLSDFDPAVDLVPYEQLPSLDKHALGRLSGVVLGVQQHYEEYSFYKISKALVNYCNLDLSAAYFVFAKDRLYVSRADDLRRRSCQTVLFHILEQLTTVTAPILPHLAEEVWQNTPYCRAADSSSSSVFQNGWVKDWQSFPEHESDLWARLHQVRDDTNRCIDLARRDKLVGAPMDCLVYLHSADPALNAVLSSMQGDATFGADAVSTNAVDDLRFFFTASQVRVTSSAEELLKLCPLHNIMPEQSSAGITVGVVRAEGTKCNRCWLYCQSVGTHSHHHDVCLRCADVLIADKHNV